MATNRKLDYIIVNMLESTARNIKAHPLNLGGVGGGTGGLGGPPGGFIGWLPQTRVAYDETEAATLDTLPSGFNPPSGWSLVDNLNHIRYRLNILESGILIVDDWDSNPIITNVREITFSGAIVTDLGNGHALVVVSGGGGGSALTVMDADSTPTVSNVDTIIFSGFIVEDLGSGDVRVTNSGIMGSNEFHIDQSGGTSDTYGILAGSVNGSNTVFTTSASKYISGSLVVYLNGQLQTQGTGEDWVETSPAAGTFTFNTAPLTGDLISAVSQVEVVTLGNADTVDGFHASAFAVTAHTHEVDQRSDIFNDGEGDPAAIGTAADGTSTYAARRDHVHAAESDQAVLGSSFDITGSTGVFQDTGLSVTLPSAGTYLINATIRGAIASSALVDHIVVKFYNSTDSADVADSETLVILVSIINTNEQDSVSMTNIVTVAASKTIKLYAARNFSGTVTLSQISTNASGKTRMNYVKVG